MARKKARMSSAAREAKNAYLRQWKRDHPERIKEYERRYWEKKAQQAEAFLNAQEGAKV